MRLGLCLSGGGAKGAFQGGVIKRFTENNIKPHIITGTSIGAVNAYFVMKNGIGNLEKFWTAMHQDKYIGYIDKTIENKKIIDELEKLQGNNEALNNVFVNYVHVENKNLTQRIVDIKALTSEEALKAVKYSSLLPARAEISDNAGTFFNSQKLFEYFKEDLENGIYEGYNLDGGILNNYLLSPFINEKVDKIVIIPLKNEYNVPEYLYNYYKEEDIYVLEPDVKIDPADTVRFENKYCNDMFERGYKAAENLVLGLRSSIKQDYKECEA